MFFMVTGTAEVVVPIDNVQELVVAVLRGGSFFGEMALVQDVRRTASVMAVTLCEVLVLSKTDFIHLVGKHTDLQRIFLAEVFARHNVTNLMKKEVDDMYQSSESPSSNVVSYQPHTTLKFDAASNAAAANPTDARIDNGSRPRPFSNPFAGTADDDTDDQNEAIHRRSL